MVVGRTRSLTSADIQALAEGETLTDTATIEVSDGEDTASATVTIHHHGCER